MGSRSRNGWILVLASLALCGASGGDPGVLFELDRGSFELAIRDQRDGEAGPRLRVAVGSPAHTTPSGNFPLYVVIRDPAWNPGADARALGAKEIPSSPRGPMGVAKLPFARGGYALHGGAHPLHLGKPVSLGCVRIADSDLLALLAWLEERKAIGASVSQPDGERHQAFLRPARVIIR